MQQQKSSEGSVMNLVIDHSSLVTRDHSQISTSIHL